MKTALVFVLVIWCGLTMCAKKYTHLDYKTTDVAYPLKHKNYFDGKYKKLGVADPSDVADPRRHRKYIGFQDPTTSGINRPHCKSLTQTCNSNKYIPAQSQEN